MRDSGHAAAHIHIHIESICGNAKSAEFSCFTLSVTHSILYLLVLPAGNKGRCSPPTAQAMPCDEMEYFLMCPRLACCCG